MLPPPSSTVAAAPRRHAARKRLTRSTVYLCVAGLGLATVACETTPEETIKTSATASGGSGGERAAASGGSATQGSVSSGGANGSASGGTGGGEANTASGGSGGAPWATDSGGNGGTHSEAGAAGAQADGAGGQAGEVGTEGSGGAGGDGAAEARCADMCDHFFDKGCDGYNRGSCMNGCVGGHRQFRELGCEPQYAAEVACVATADIEEFACNESGSVDYQLACLAQQCSLLRCWYYAEDYEFDVPECEGF